MRKSFLAALAVWVSLAVCAGCAGAPEAVNDKAAGQTGEEGTEPGGRAPGLTEEQISQVLTAFAGVSREHARETWEADRKWKQATAEFRAYWDTRRRFNKNDPALLSLAIKTHNEAKKVLNPLCSLYPHNTPLNSMDEDITRGLHSLLEAQRRSEPAGDTKSP